MSLPSSWIVAAVALTFVGAAVAEESPPAPSPQAPAPPAAAPVRLDPKKLKAPKQTPELLEKGKAAFAANCVTCHGEKGAGDGPAGLYMNPKPRDFTKDPFKQGTRPEEIFVTVTEGVKDTLMVGWPQISEEERWGLSYYVLTMVPKPDNKAPAKKK
jgi:mono/diheme cytochrome c family protein